MGTSDYHSLEIGADDLRRTVAPGSLGFASTDSLPTPSALVGQERGLEAIAFALAIKDHTYNLYVSGDAGVGRSTAVMRAVEQAARNDPSGQDWCYVYHFERPGEPIALVLPPGTAPVFARAIDTFVAACQRELHRAFTSDAYLQQRKATLKNLEDQREQTLASLQHEALTRGFLIQFTPAGVATIPLKLKEAESSAQRETASAASAETANQTPEPMTPVEFESLPDEARQRITAANEMLQTVIARTLAQLNGLDEEAQIRLHDLNDTVARNVVGLLTDPLISHFRDMPRVVEYIH
ncbi:MAG TPA: Lon-like protease helical domain-containing protein [Ktedonobacterales bacterium]|jgi:hypothetical protein